MLVMWTAEYPADPVSEFVGAQRTLRLYHLTFAMDPLGLYGVKPRALLGQKAAYDPHSISTLFDLEVMFSEPPPELFRDVPAGVVPDENHNLLSNRFELLTTPPEKLSRYRANGPTIHETQPRLIELRQVESVAGDRFRIGIVFSDRFLKEAQRLSHFGPAALKVGKASRLHQHSSSKPTAHSESAAATSISRSRRLFSFVQRIRGADPAFGSLPTHSKKARQSSPDGLPRDTPFDESLLKGNLCCHLQSP